MRATFNKREAENRQRESAEKQKNVKLPKLVITRFQGNCIDWTRFWSQFEVEIDKSSIEPIVCLFKRIHSYQGTKADRRLAFYRGGI